MLVIIKIRCEEHAIILVNGYVVENNKWMPILPTGREIYPLLLAITVKIASVYFAHKCPAVNYIWQIVLTQ